MRPMSLFPSPFMSGRTVPLVVCIFPTEWRHHRSTFIRHLSRQQVRSPTSLRGLLAGGIYPMSALDSIAALGTIASVTQFSVEEQCASKSGPHDYP